MGEKKRDAWGVSPDWSNMPAELTELRRWCVWAGVMVDGKRAKRPFRPLAPRTMAKVSDLSHWASFEEARTAYLETPIMSGVGLLLTGIRKDIPGFLAIDIDRCVDPETGGVAPWALDVVEALPTYWELSPSGRGLRGFLTTDGAKVQMSFLNRRSGLEVYDGSSARYVTVTGRRLEGASGVVRELAADTVLAALEPYRSSERETGQVSREVPEPQEVNFELTRLPSVFRTFLSRGDVGGKYESRSELMHGLTMALSRAGYSPEQAYTVLCDNPHSWSYAMEHREGNTGRGQQFLWAEVQRGYTRAPVQGSDPMDFFGIVEDEVPQPATPRKGAFRASELDGVPLKEREWAVDGWLPLRTVTLLYGDGGTGKSLLAQELLYCVSKGVPFYGFETSQGPALGLFCEDDVDELHRRQLALQKKYATPLKDTTDVILCSRVGMDNTLLSFDPSGVATRHPLFDAVVKSVHRWGAKVLVLDTLADMFAGKENDRPQARQFINALAGIALEGNCAVLVCAHPSVAGRERGTSGSTAWDATVRSRWHFMRDPDDPDVRRLERKKANYAAIGERVQVIWSEGAFYGQDTPRGKDYFESHDAMAEEMFREGMRALARMKQPVSAQKQGGRYAPKLIMEHYRATNDERLKVVTQPSLEMAMQRLRNKGVIVERDVRKGRARELAFVHDLVKEEANFVEDLLL